MNERDRYAWSHAAPANAQPDDNNNLVAFVDVENLTALAALCFDQQQCAVDIAGRTSISFPLKRRTFADSFHVEIGRENSMSWSAGQLRICALHHFGALLPKTQDQLVSASPVSVDTSIRAKLWSALLPILISMILNWRRALEFDQHLWQISESIIMPRSSIVSENMYRI